MKRKIMKINYLSILICCALLLGLNACNSSKKAKEKEAVEAAEKVVEETTYAKEKAAEKEMKQQSQKLENTKINSSQPSSSDKGTAASGGKRPLEETGIIPGTYEWVKTICCGRMRNVKIPDESEKKTRVFKSSGELVETAGPENRATNKNWKIVDNEMLDDHTVLQIDDGRNAIIRYKGDTLIIDYGYMDLQTEFWLRK